MTDPLFLTDKSRENHARVIRALEICSNILRDVLEKDVQPCDLASRAKTKALFYGKLTKYEISDIQNAARNKTYINLDITLLYALVRNLCLIVAPKSGWGVQGMPLTHDTEIADDIERIRIIRNNVAGHRAKMSIEDSDFQKCWKEISDVCSRMESRTDGKYTESLETVRTCTMDAKLEHIKSISTAEMNNFKDSFYVNIDRIIFQGFDLLTTNNKLIITGIGGSGKTYTALQTAVKLSNSKNNLPIYIIGSTEEFFCVSEKDQLQILVLDDPFGKSNINNELLHSWEKCFSRMEALSSQKKLFIILCCRTSILEVASSTLRKYNFFKEKNIIDLSGICQLNKEERKLMFLEYIKQYESEGTKHITNATINKIVEQTPRLGFPQSCYLYFNNKDTLNRGWDSFVKADDSLQREIDALKFEFPDCFLILVYMIHRTDFVVDVTDIDMVLIGQLYDILEFEKRPSHFLRSVVEIKLLEMSLIRRSRHQDCYTFQHETVQESVLICYCKHFCPDFLEMAPLRTVLEFIRPSTYTNKSGEMYFVLPKQCDKQLAQLYVSNIVSEKIQYRFLDSLLYFDKYFLDIFLDETQKSGQERQNYKSSSKARSIFVNDLIRYFLLNENYKILSSSSCVSGSKLSRSISPRQSFIKFAPADCNPMDSTIITLLLALYPDVHLNCYCWKLIAMFNRCDILQNIFQQKFYNLPKDWEDEIIDKDRVELLHLIVKHIPHLITEHTLLLAIDKNADKSRDLLLSSNLPNKTSDESKCTYRDKSWDNIMRRDEVSKIKLIVAKKPSLIDRNAVSSSISMAAKKSFRVLVTSGTLNILDTGKSSYQCNWDNIMERDEIQMMKLIVEFVPDLIDNETIASAVTHAAKKSLSILLTCGLPNMPFIFENACHKCIWKRLMLKDDSETLESIIKHAPQLISEHTIVSAVTHTKKCLRLLLTSELLCIFQAIEKSCNKCNLVNSVYRDDLETMELVVTKAPILINENTLVSAVTHAAKRCLRLLLTCDLHNISDIIHKSCFKFQWKKIMRQDECETMQLIVTKAPQLINENTLASAVTEAAINSLRLLLTCGLLNISDIIVKCCNLCKWKEIMLKDKNGVMELILENAPQFINETLLVSAITEAAKNSLHVLLTCESINISDIIYKSCSKCQWVKIMYKDDINTMQLIVKRAPDLINENALVMAVSHAAKRTLFLLLTSDLPNISDIIEKSCFKCQWNKIMKRDQQELMELIVKYAPKLINESTLVSAMTYAAVRSLRLLFSCGLPNISDIIHKSHYKFDWRNIMEQDDIEVIELILEYAPSLINENTLVGAISQGAKHSLRLLLTCGLPNISEFILNRECQFDWSNVMDKDIEIMELIIEYAPRLISENSFRPTT